MSSINCPNKKKILASFITNASVPEQASWDLTPYQTAGLAKPGSTWRLIETGANLLYESGKVSADGTLVSFDYEEPIVNSATRNARSSTQSSLSDRFYSHYNYPGYMELQVEEPEEECPNCPDPSAE